MKYPALLLRALLCALFGVTSLSAQIPQTPPGQQLSGWINAINSADRATIQQFFDKSMPGRPVDGALAISNQTGGYELKKVEESSDTRVVALLQERGGARQFVRITLNVNAEAPDRIAGIRLQPAEAPPDMAPPKLTAAEAQSARDGAPFRQFSAWLDAFNSGKRERISQ